MPLPFYSKWYYRSVETVRTSFKCPFNVREVVKKAQKTAMIPPFYGADFIDSSSGRAMNFVLASK